MPVYSELHYINIYLHLRYEVKKLQTFQSSNGFADISNGFDENKLKTISMRNYTQILEVILYNNS